MSVPIIQSDQGLYAYMRQANSYPMLSVEEEYMLAKRVHDYQDVEAAHTLVISHLRLVIKMAMGMRGYGMTLMDLISEGNIGLMHAVKKFKPDLGYRLSTYAMWWIRASMQEFIIKSWSIVKIGTTVAQKKLFFNLEKVKKKIRKLNNQTSVAGLSPSEVTTIADELQISEKDVASMNSRLTLSDISLDAPINNVDGNSYTTILDTIADDRESHGDQLADSQDIDHKRVLFKEAVSKLNDREKYIITTRHLQDKPETLEVLSQKYSISRERVRQIEARALEKVKEHCTSSLVISQL